MLIDWEGSPTTKTKLFRRNPSCRWGLSAVSSSRAAVNRKTSTSVARPDHTGKTHRRRSPYGWYGPLAVLLLIASIAGCGYRLAGERVDSGAGQTLAVPVFRNLTTEFRIEQQLTAAVRRELIRRTRYRVTPTRNGDVILAGEVLGINSIPIIFTDQGRGTAYTVAVDVRVRVTDTADGSILFQNDRWTFSEVFELSNDSEAFVAEDSAAIDRLARQFASSLVASLAYANPNP